ncbi:MAG: uroporphyrinogen decarboxylase [Gemmataceae bacterium]
MTHTSGVRHSEGGGSLFVRALRGEWTERPPVWAMRQAGRWDPAFQELRDGLTFYEFTRDVERAAAASLLPQRFGVDALILFYDITTLAEAMGLPFALRAGSGPHPARVIEDVAAVRRLEAPAPRSGYEHVRQVLQRVRQQVAGSLPILIFAGAPFTLASYCIGAGKNLERVRAFAAEQPVAWQELLDRIAVATVEFVRDLMELGADAFQLFDTWAGGLHADEYARWAAAYHRRIFAALRQYPSLLFVRECPHIEPMMTSGAWAVSLGTRHDLAAVRRQYPHVVVQGNVDAQLLAQGMPTEVREATLSCMAATGGRRHIVNLNHGVEPCTPVVNFQTFVDTVRSYGPCE